MTALRKNRGDSLVRDQNPGDITVLIQITMSVLE